MVHAGSYFESLAQQFGGSDLEFGSSDDDHTGKVFTAFSHHADDLEDAELAGRRIYSLQVLANGALRIANGNLGMVPLGFFEFNDGRSRHQIRALELEEYPFSSAKFIDQDQTLFRNPKRDLSSYLLYLAKSDNVIRVLLLLAGTMGTHETLLRIHSWASLYKMLDTLKYGCQQQGWEVTEFASKANIERFTAACNNESILGIEARHGLNSAKPPTRVMKDLEEAAEFLLGMARNYALKFIGLQSA